MKCVDILTCITIFSILLITFLFTGCAAGSKINSSVRYSSPNFDEISFENEGVAILPIIIKEGYAIYKRPFVYSLNLQLKNSMANFTDANDSFSILFENDLIDVFNKVLEDYGETRLFDGGSLRRIADEVRHNYLMIIELSIPVPEMAMTQQQGAVYVPPLGTTGVGHFAPTSTNVMSTTRRNVNCTGLIWSVTDSEIVWEANVSISYHHNETTIERCEKVAANLIKELFGSLSN